MNIIDFTVDALNHHQMWYVLTKEYTDWVDIYRPGPNGNAPYTEVSAYRMFNQRVLIGFNNILDAQSQNGLVAEGENGIEYVSTQPYERIYHLLNINPLENNPGSFAFTDSVPVIQPGTDWRCDNGRYGPRPYQDCNGVTNHPISEKSVMLEYETIVSLPGIAHLIYLRRSDYEEERNNYLNNSATQMATATLPEMFVLLNEWAQVSQYPFENSEEIAKDSKKFIDAIGFDQSFIDGHPPMQIAKFLMGDTNARLRPENPLPMNQQLHNFVKNRCAHISLSSLLSTNPGVWDLLDVAELEEPFIYQNMLKLYKHFLVNDAPDGFSTDILRERILPKMPEGYAGYIESWFVSYDRAEGFRQSFI